MTESSAASHPIAVTLSRLSTGHYRATNADGATLEFGGEGFLSPVELLLAAMAGCTAIDVDYATTRSATPTQFDLVASGEKATDPQGRRHLDHLSIDFRLNFDGDGAQKAESMLKRLITLSHNKDCTVSRTVELPSPVTVSLRGETIASGQPED